MVFILSALWWRRIRGLWKLHDGRDWLRGKLDLVLMGRAMFNKSLIQFSVDEWCYIPSLLFDLRQNYGGGNEDNGNLLQNVPGMHCCTQCPWPCSRPLLTHTSTVDTQTQFWLSLCGLGMCFVPFPGLSHSGDQVLVPGGPNALITSPANRKLD